MDYKDTLNLPRTDFPMKADLVGREPQRLEKWEKQDLYQKIQAARAGAPKFVLHDGPPFANGNVHVGTALNKILKDIIIKYKTLRGFAAPYVPGWDCHGLPIEYKVMQTIRADLIAKKLENSENPGKEFKKDVIEEPFKSSALEIREKCKESALNWIENVDGSGQKQQFKRLGILGDWDNPYLTLNGEYEAEELRLFAEIVEKGFVYRGKKPVYWSIPARTALAEAEIEYHDNHVSQSVYVKFPVVGQPGIFIVIWTTTPWTLPANLAIAYNDKFEYVQLVLNGETLLIASNLLTKVQEACGWPPVLSMKGPRLAATDLSKLEYHHPFCNRTGKLFPAGFVTDDTGTGFVHIAPGHGLDDYNLGRQHGLPIYSPVDDNGAFAYTDDLPREQQMPAEMIGKSTLEKNGKSDANEAVLHELRVRGLLLYQQEYRHSYPFCWRSKTPIIYRAMDQWFIQVDHRQVEWEKRFDEVTNKPDRFNSLPMELKFDREKEGGLRSRAMIAVTEEVKWIPEWGSTRILGALASRPDWCISRQRTWGVPIPAFYDADGKAILDAQIIRNTAALFKDRGSNVWFEKSVAELWTSVKPAGWKGVDPVTKSNDTLDVWIDSGSSSRAVLKARKELQHEKLSGDDVWRADVYLEGSDQHRGWFQSSLLLSLAGNGVAPFKTVLTHGFMVDADREKISKSKQGQGGYEKPQTSEAYIKKYGADVLRLWVASQDYRNDIVVSEERINKVSETYRGIRNTLRYQLSNLYDFDPAKHTVPDDKLTGLDRWILGKFSKLEAEVMAAYDQYEFHVVYQKVSQFIAVELSSVYHDVVKDRLYTDAANSPRRRSTQTALHQLVTGLCKMLAPFLVFSTDEAWEFVPKKTGESVHELSWEASEFAGTPDGDSIWSSLFALRDGAMPELEKARQNKLIGKALDAKLHIALRDAAQLAAHKETLRELLNVSQLDFKHDPGAETPAFTVEKADGQKCERCWHWETDVGSVPEHPTICARCVAAVKESRG